MAEPIVLIFGIFVLAIFIGYYVVWNVTPALHTPLMSVTNAISSVIVIGALLGITADTGEQRSTAELTAKIFAFIALTLAMVNIFGGFIVTNRMLTMFKRKNDEQQQEAMTVLMALLGKLTKRIFPKKTNGEN